MIVAINVILIGNWFCSCYQLLLSEEYDRSFNFVDLVCVQVNLVMTDCSQTQLDRAASPTYRRNLQSLHYGKCWNCLGLKYHDPAIYFGSFFLI